MAGDLLNNLARLAPTQQRVRGVIAQNTAANGSTVSLTQLVGFVESDQTQVSLSRSSAGVYVLTIQNFVGDAGAANLILTSNTGAVVGSPCYTVSTSGTTSTFTINTFNSAGAAADVTTAFDALTY